jgi:hypothetical protein
MKDLKQYIPLVTKIIEWAHKNNKKVQYLTKEDLQQAVRCR